MILIEKLSFARENNVIFDEASAHIAPGTRTGLVGRNGCGKSTLFELITGDLSPDGGRITVPESWTIATVAQETPSLDISAEEYVIDGDKRYRSLERELKAAEERNDGMAIARISGELEISGAYTIRPRTAALLSGLGFSQEQIKLPVKDFSGGWRMRLNLAQALICHSDLLLLDEPTNHLDLDAVMFLSDYLKGYRGTLMIISHDREFLDDTVDHIIHIENKKLNEYTADYSGFERMRAERLAQNQALYERQQQSIAKIQSFIDRFRYKATKARQAQSRLKALEKMDRIAAAHPDSPFHFSFRAPEQLPVPLMNMEDISIGYEAGKPVIKSMKLNLTPGARIGLLGRNGAGKSTLIKFLAGMLKPLTGRLSVAKGIKIGYFAQHQLDYLNPDQSALWHMQRLAPEMREQDLRNFLGGFAFSGDKALEKAGTLSGGEKARLALALIVWQKPNLLLLDEPTNHLDLNMRDALSAALQDFAGAMIIVSHDRHLLRTTADDFYLVDKGMVSEFSGDLDDYHKYLIEQRKQELSQSASERREQRIQEKQAASGGSTQISWKGKKELLQRLRAEARPLRKNAEELEKRMNAASARLEEIETALSDSGIYDASRKEELSALLREQGELSKASEKVEAEWLEASEKLEEAESRIKEAENASSF